MREGTLPPHTFRTPNGYGRFRATLKGLLDAVLKRMVRCLCESHLLSMGLASYAPVFPGSRAGADCGAGMYLKGSRWSMNKRRQHFNWFRIIVLTLLIAAGLYLDRFVIPAAPSLFEPTPTATRPPESYLTEA